MVKVKSILALFPYEDAQKRIKVHANGPNIVVTCCVRLHGTTTMLAFVGTCCVQFETGQTLGLTSPNISIVL